LAAIRAGQKVPELDTINYDFKKSRGVWAARPVKPIELPPVPGQDLADYLTQDDAPQAVQGAPRGVPAKERS
jgi:hypothetical protein